MKLALGETPTIPTASPTIALAFSVILMGIDVIIDVWRRPVRALIVRAQTRAFGDRIGNRMQATQT